eukprot:g3958.t1
MLFNAVAKFAKAKVLGVKDTEFNLAKDEEEVDPNRVDPKSVKWKGQPDPVYPPKLVEYDGIKYYVDVVDVRYHGGVTDIAWEPWADERGAVFIDWVDHKEEHEKMYPNMVEGCTLVRLNYREISQDTKYEELMSMIADAERPRIFTFHKNFQEALEPLDVMMNEKGYQQLRQPLINATRWIKNGKIQLLMKSLESLEIENINASIDRMGNTLLGAAITYGRFGCVETLVDFGISLERRNDEGYNALALAVMCGNLRVIQYLLRILKKPSKAVEHFYDKNGRNLLHIAARYGHTEIFQFIWSVPGGNTKGHELVLQFDRNRWQPLHYAAKWGHSEIVKFIIDKECPVHKRSKAGKMAIEVTHHGVSKKLLQEALFNGFCQQIMCKYDEGIYDFTDGEPTVIPNTIGELWVGTHRAAQEDWCRSNDIKAVFTILHSREVYPTMEVGWMYDGNDASGSDEGDDGWVKKEKKKKKEGENIWRKPKRVQFILNTDDMKNGDWKQLAKGIAKAVPLLHDTLTNGKNVLIHCGTGFNASPTVVAAYMMTKWNIPLKFVYRWMEQKHPRFDPEPVYRKGLEELFEAYKDKVLEISNRKFRKRMMMKK